MEKPCLVSTMTSCMGLANGAWGMLHLSCSFQSLPYFFTEQTQLEFRRQEQLLIKYFSSVFLGTEKAAGRWRVHWLGANGKYQC